MEPSKELNASPEQPVYPQYQIPDMSKVKRSKKENALFELQNQMNSQMLAEITELTNKVAKLKSWKKKMKQEMYEEDVITDKTPQVNPQMDPQNYYEYMNRINDSEEPEVEQSEQLITYPTGRYSIHYSKFGF